MLAQFRKHSKSWAIKVAFFAIVIVFVFWGGYAYKERKEGQVARVDDHYISRIDYDRSYNQMVDMYRRQLGGAFSEDLLRQLNLKKQAVDVLIDRYLLIKASHELGLSVPTEEVQRRVLEYPVFQTEGKFDKQRYAYLLRQNRLTPEAFEGQLTQDLTLQKVESFMKRQATVSEEEILADYQFNYNLVQLSYVLVNPLTYEDKVEMDPKAIQAFYQDRQDQYKDPETRQLSYVLFKTSDSLGAVQAADDELRQYYEDHLPTYQKEKEVRARHILFAVKEDAPEAEVAKVKAEAQKVLDEAQKGKDFADLAKKYSQDPSAAKNGGDLGFFTREKMVPAFSEAAFNLKQGVISDLVRTPFGFHIIKVEDIHPEKKSTFEEVRSEVETAVKQQKARDLVYGKARDFTDLAFAQKDIEKAAKANNLQMAGSQVWVKNNDALPGLEGASAELINKFFSFSEREVSDPLESPEGFVVGQVLAIQSPKVIPLERIKDRIEKEYKLEKSRILAQQAASELLEAARKGKSLEEAAKGMKAEFNTSEWFSRTLPTKKLSPLKAEGQSSVFQLTESRPFPDAPIELGSRFLVCQLLGKKTPLEDLESSRPEISKKVLQQKQSMLWQSWLEEQRRKSKIEYFQEL